MHDYYVFFFPLDLSMGSSTSTLASLASVIPVQKLNEPTVAVQPPAECPMHQQQTSVTAPSTLHKEQLETVLPPSECPMHNKATVRPELVNAAIPQEYSVLHHKATMQSETVNMAIPSECPMHNKESPAQSKPVNIPSECPMHQVGTTTKTPVPDVNANTQYPSDCPMHQESVPFISECPSNQSDNAELINPTNMVSYIFFYHWRHMRVVQQILSLIQKEET